jgi:uncharacterized protein (TIGR02147 family)
MRDIEFYTDYRKFLSDFYAEKKKSSSGYSYRDFCLKAGLGSPSIYREVVSAKRNLSRAAISAFIRGLGLSEKDGRFFENLVLFNQAKTEHAKKKHIAILQGLRYKKPRKIIPVHLYEFYEKWYHPVIRELAVAMDWKDDFGMLAKCVIPQIKTSEARESMALQLSLGFLRKAADGGYVQTDPDISTGSEVNSLAVRQMNRCFAQFGVEAIDRFPVSERDVSSLVMGVPQSMLPQLKQEIADFRRKLIDLAGAAKAVDGVYTVVVELFPVGKAFPVKERKYEVD